MNVLVVLGGSLVIRIHSQLIIPYQFKCLAFVAAELGHFSVNPQTGLPKYSLIKVNQFGISSVGIGFPRSRLIILQADIMDIGRFDNRSPLDYL